jgi:hypothetical protein
VIADPLLPVTVVRVAAMTVSLVSTFLVGALVGLLGSEARTIELDMALATPAVAKSV